MKDKRHALRGTLERLRRGLGVSLAEVGDHDLWGNATLGCACVADNRPQAESLLDAVQRAFDDRPDVEVEGFERDFQRY